MPATKSNSLALAVGLVLFSTPAAPQAHLSAPSNDEIRAILKDRIEVRRQSVGIVVGVIDAQGPRTVGYGSLDKNDPRPLNGETLFEIGSLTKLFTSLLLTKMVERREVALADPVAKYLPPGVQVPEFGGRSITLVDLATHTSGLPRSPANLTVKDPYDPFADYTPQLLYAFLSSYQLTRDIGSQWEYSNVGSGLLGHALALRAGMSYEDAVRLYITQPLDMNGTRISLRAEDKARLAVGHNSQFNAVPNWRFQALAGAGAYYSSVSDLLKLLAVALGYARSPLAPAMAAMLDVLRPTTTAGLDNAIGWQISTPDAMKIIWKDGGTYGYASFLGYNPRAGVGVAVLSNMQTFAGVNDIGMHVLDPKSPLFMLPRQPRERRAIVLGPATLDRYVGFYRISPSVTLAVTRQGGHLFAQFSGQAKTEIFPENERDFFYKSTDAQISFESVGSGPASALTFHQFDIDQHARRISAVPPAKPHRQVKVDPKRFDLYTGRYRLSPSLIITVTRVDRRFFAQTTGQPKFEIFAESERDYFLKDVDAEIKFQTDAQGRASAVMVLQAGVQLDGRRIE